MTPLPQFTVDLLEELDKQNPPACIGTYETLEEAHRRAGRRALIDELLLRQKRTDEKSRKVQQP